MSKEDLEEATATVGPDLGRGSTNAGKSHMAA